MRYLGVMFAACIISIAARILIELTWFMFSLPADVQRWALAGAFVWVVHRTAVQLAETRKQAEAVRALQSMLGLKESE